MFFICHAEERNGRKREKKREGMPKDMYFCKEQAMAGCEKDYSASTTV
jgi:hypothetical protein